MFKEPCPHKAQVMVEEDSANVVNIRGPRSYSVGHILNVFSLNNGNVKGYVESADKEKPLIVCCYHGISSRRATEYLPQNGFKEVYGGFEAWPDRPNRWIQLTIAISASKLYWRLQKAFAIFPPTGVSSEQTLFHQLFESWPIGPTPSRPLSL